MNFKNLVVNLKKEVDRIVACGGRTDPPGSLKPSDLQTLKDDLDRMLKDLNLLH